MDYQKIDRLLVKIKSAYDKIGAETELMVDAPKRYSRSGSY